MKSPIMSFFTGAGAFIGLLIAAAVSVGIIISKPEVGANLASAVVGGIGSAIGAFIGSLLIFRFKSARRFVHRIFNVRLDDFDDRERETSRSDLWNGSSQQIGK